MAERPVLSKKPLRNRILVPIKSSEPEDSEDTARLGLLNWLSISQAVSSNTGSTMKALIPKNLHTNLLSDNEVIARRNPMLFPTQNTNANTLEELQLYIMNHIVTGVKNAYGSVIGGVHIKLKWVDMTTDSGAFSKPETEWKLVGVNANTLAKIIVLHQETSYEQLTEGLDIFFEGFEVDIAATE